MAMEMLDALISATEETLEMMCGVKARLEGATAIENPHHTDCNIIAAVGFSGTRKAVVLMTLSLNVAKRISQAFVGEAVEENAELMDAVGELLNIIAGGATAQVPGLELSLPAVVYSNGCDIYSQKDRPWYVVALTVEGIGSLKIELAMDQ